MKNEELKNVVDYICTKAKEEMMILAQVIKGTSPDGNTGKLIKAAFEEALEVRREECAGAYKFYYSK